MKARLRPPDEASSENTVGMTLTVHEAHAVGAGEPEALATVRDLLGRLPKKADPDAPETEVHSTVAAKESDLGRHYMCEVCGKPIAAELEGCVMKGEVTFPMKEGKPQPPLKVMADCCSAPCLIQYVRERLLPDLARVHSKWASYGTTEHSNIAIDSRFAGPSAAPALPAGVAPPPQPGRPPGPTGLLRPPKR